MSMEAGKILRHYLVDTLYESTPLLIRSLRESRSTGAFIIFEATLNSALSKTATSRCGVYLKINTPVNFNTVQAPIVWLR